MIVRNPAVIAAITEAFNRGPAYVGAFLLKDEAAELDVIERVDQVHDVGVFAHVTAIYPSAPSGSSASQSAVNAVLNQSDPSSSSPSETPESITLVLHPTRRIKITELLPPRAGKGVEKAVEVIREEIPLSDANASKAKEVEEGEEGRKEEDAVEPEESTYQTSFLQDFEVSIANVENYDELSSPIPTDLDTPEFQTQRATMGEILETLKQMTTYSHLLRDQIANFSQTPGTTEVFQDPVKLADFCAAICLGEPAELQAILASTDLSERLRIALTVLKKELMNSELQAKISKDVEGNIQKRQREYFLMEQLRAIKKDLGVESDGKERLVQKFREKAEELNMPDHVKVIFEEELNRLQHLEPVASEFNVTRNYVDWLTQIPWGKHSVENLDIKNAVKVLDEDHYGLQEVKDRILEFLAVGKLRGKVDGKILCFVGPPGVAGKTSIGKSIARALNRQFFRFSVGGLTDVAEIKGHRRTYVGAMPGKMIQALKKVQAENPLILIDEVDKIGRGYNGDPSSALLEMLDPEQNASFLDHYLDCPVDLSKVLFVCTANVLDTIPAPLLDRMEIMEVSGYVADEKMAIASQYLGPQAKESTGLTNASVELTKEALEVLIRYYARESGVRRLKQLIEKVYRKAAFKIVRDIDEAAEKEEKVIKEQGEEGQVEPASSVPVEGEVKEEVKESEKVEQEKETAKVEVDKVESAEIAGEKTESTTVEGEKTTTTTTERKPLDIPESVQLRITPDNLIDYVGPAVYQKDRIYTNRCPAGVSTGLGYLGNGSGSVMPIEVSSMPGKGDVQLTGKLGEVIKESAQIALTFLKSNAYALGLTKERDDDLIYKRSIHLHMPEGSIGKEGPSAGTAILTAFTSLFSGHGLPSELAMTGEMTLAGQVLPVGGLKEKILAAHRAGIKTIIAPAANKPDIEHNVPDSVKEGITIIYANDIRDVLKVAFEGTPIVEKLKNLKMPDREEVKDIERREAVEKGEFETPISDEKK
ncbi:ATP-dependent protease La [Atractiella rhizophila]|nr:ATP-dependent protease La [Atractiella rhizophila]